MDKRNIKNVQNTINRILSSVEKPSRYTGGEYNQVVKDRENADVRVALCFPDTYEIGMSNLGVRILYGVLNSIENVWCERVFAPWPDMEEKMREQSVRLYGLESYDEIKDFDIIAFSLGYELSYTNVLNMLDLAGVKCRRSDRDEDTPLVIAGGTCCFNPEPMADFIDLFVIGDGEEVIVEIIDVYNSTYGKTGKGGGKGSKSSFLEKASKLTGVYAPSLLSAATGEKSASLPSATTGEKSTAAEKCESSPSATTVEKHETIKTRKTIKKRVVKDLDKSYFPTKTIVPSMSIVHDRAILELFRGCVRGCKFCQAGHVYNPVRMRSPEKLLEQGKEAIINSGYDEIALLSLSTSDYKHLNKLCDSLLDWCEPRKVNLSLPSLRADNFSMGLMERVQKVRKSGLTFAPEAGTQRLRDYINKRITEEDLLSACEAAFAGGWNTVKLYFMLGLPTETDDDVIGIADLAYKVLDTWKDSTKNRKRGVRITVSTSCFIPKPHTPFERETQISIAEYLRRVELLKGKIRTKKITYNWHSPEQGYIEAALSRGDRQIGGVIEAAWRMGARFDAWSEYFSSDIWIKAFEKCLLNPDDFAVRKRSDDENLPWDFVSARGDFDG